MRAFWSNSFDSFFLLFLHARTYRSSEGESESVPISVHRRTLVHSFILFELRYQPISTWRAAIPAKYLGSFECAMNSRPTRIAEAGGGYRSEALSNGNIKPQKVSVCYSTADGPTWQVCHRQDLTHSKLTAGSGHRLLRMASHSHRSPSKLAVSLLALHVMKFSLCVVPANAVENPQCILLKSFLRI